MLERVTDILAAFDSPDRDLLLEEIVDLTGLPRSTAFRLLTQLVELEWLNHDSNGYSLGRRARRMSRYGANHSPLRAAAADHLSALHFRSGGVAHLTVLEGGFAHYLDKVGGTDLRVVPSAIGRRLPADSTASGLALLAGQDRVHVDSVLASAGRARGHDEVHVWLDLIRRHHGVAVTPPKLCPLGIRVVAAPVIGPRGVVAAVSVAHQDAPSVDALAPLVIQAARGTSAALFPTWTARNRRGRRSRRRVRWSRKLTL